MPFGTQHADDDVNGKEVNTLQVDPDNEVVVDVVDDTPPEDKGRKPLEKDPLSDPDAEAARYTKGVQKRIGELTHKAHDERRAREQAQRERDEAIKIAQAAMKRQSLLESQLTNGEAAFAREAESRAKLALDAARAKYRKAYDAGDPDAIAEATAEIAAAAQQELAAKNWASAAAQKVQQIAGQQSQAAVESPENRSQVQANPQAQAVEEPDEHAVAWNERNKDWFGVDPIMTSLVYGVHEKLVMQDGLHPVNDAEKYYARIDEEMRRRFPDYEWTEADADDPPAKTAAKSPAKKPTPAVAPVSRTPAGGAKKVVLTKTEAALAEKLGLTAEQYAREKLKLNGA